MAYRSRGSIRFAILLLTVLTCIYRFSKDTTNSRSIVQSTTDKQRPSADILQSLSLTEDQCAAAFPGLTNEIDDAVARGPFLLRRQPDHHTGLVQGRIKNGEILFDQRNIQHTSYINW